MAKIMVAMSGGVDSAVTALLLQKLGYEVYGVHLLLHENAEVDAALIDCCCHLGIPLTVRDCREKFFSRVLMPGAAEYARGRTPNPCCECNAALKFYELFAAADEAGISLVATGHYVQMEHCGDEVKIVPAADQSKDQSYFLYRLNGAQLRRCVFPLGKYSKSEVRAIAAENSLICASRPDSQDACFQVPGECCGNTLSRLCRLSGKRGRFIYQGKNVGRHSGIHAFTIGQRQGLGVALGVPAYIKRIDPDKGDIFLCTDQNELLCRRFAVTRVVWQRGYAPAPEEKILVRVRYRTAGKECTFCNSNGDTGFVTLDTAQRAVTPGQAAVFYDLSGALLGGGVISLEEAECRSESENSQPQ